jgi:UDP-N-acetylmuramate: L-alanyl-gamma-D-glutamyl-meso-diaminopimelate ligase
MKLGHHQDQLAVSVNSADQAFWYQPADIGWSLTEVAERGDIPAQVHSNLDELVTAVLAEARPGDWIVCMSNGSFQGLAKRLAALVGETQ